MAAKFDLVIFDLDGTLIDSRLDLANSANATRAFMGMGPIPNETVYSYVGNGAPMLIRRVLGPGASEDDIAKALEYFIHYYHDHRLDFTVLYPGVRKSLDALAAGGIKMAVLTNKPVRISHLIVEGLNVAHHFASVYGGNSFPEKKPSPVGILKLMEELGTAPERTLMVGDSSVDVETARNAKAVACGVTYGFQPETLHAAPPDILLDQFDELVPAVLGR